MTIYFVNMLSLLIYSYFYRHSVDKIKVKKILIYIIVIQFTLIQGLRSFDVGSDTPKYVYYYEYIKNSNFNTFDLLLNPPLNLEFGYLMLMRICSLFHISSRMFLIVIALIINVLLGIYIYKDSCDFITSFWIFIGIEFFTLSFTMIRQMIAIVIILNAYSYLKENNYKIYILLNFIAGLFHKTAFIFFIVFLIKILFEKIKKKKPNFEISICHKIIFFTIILGIIYFLLGDLINIIAHIFYGYYNFSKVNIGFLWVTMICILILFILIERKNKTSSLMEYEILIFISSCFQLMTVHIAQFSRAAFYFYIFTIVSLPYAISLIKNKKMKFFLKTVVYCLTFLQYVLFSMDIYNLVPYKFF